MKRSHQLRHRGIANGKGDRGRPVVFRLCLGNGAAESWRGSGGVNAEGIDGTVVGPTDNPEPLFDLEGCEVGLGWARLG